MRSDGSGRDSGGRSEECSHPFVLCTGIVSYEMAMGLGVLVSGTFNSAGFI